MTRTMTRIATIAIMAVVVAAMGAPAQNVNRSPDDPDDFAYYYNRPSIDRYLSAEVWTDNADGEYYEGDRITIHFRSSRDAFVAIYSIDTRGRVNLLFPADPAQDNYVRGGVTYSLPGPQDDYDLVVSGPEGFENIQIVASRDRFPIPSWYHNSGLVCDWDSRDDFMDYVNGRHFVRYDGQRFAYDRAVVYVNEWEDVYFRPVYHPYYPSWSVCGNVYFDYPWGASVYINGVYWGCTPLYVPRLVVGWHTVTIYDYRGWCWENDVHVSYYNTIVLNKAVVKTSNHTASKYKEVRTVGYRDPVKAYPNYATKVESIKKATVVRSGSGVTTGTTSPATKDIRTGTVRSTTDVAGTSEIGALSKKYIRGSSEVVKTSRGLQTKQVVSDDGKGSVRSVTKQGKSSRYGTSRRSTTDYRTPVTSGNAGSVTKRSSGSTSGSGSSSGYYERKTGSSTRSSSRRTTVDGQVKRGTVTKKSSGNSGTYRRTTPHSQKSTGTVKSTPKRSTSTRKATVKSTSKGSSSSSHSKPSINTSSRKAPGRSTSSSKSSSKSSSSSSKKNDGGKSKKKQ